jgi:uncharacterized protein
LTQQELLAPFRGRVKYVSLETFRPDGSGVATPVWFVIVDERLFCRSDPATHKMRRIRRDPRVTVAPCTLRGALKGPRLEARADLDARHDPEALSGAYARKYRLEALLAKLPVGGPPGTGDADGQVFYEILPR